MDEGRSAGAVCRRDKSTLGARGGREAEEPGVEPSVTDTHWPAQAWRCLHTVASNVRLWCNGFKSLSSYCTSRYARWDVSQSHWTYFTCSAGTELIENNHTRGLDKPCVTVQIQMLTWMCVRLLLSQTHLSRCSSCTFLCSYILFPPETSPFIWFHKFKLYCTCPFGKEPIKTSWTLRKILWTPLDLFFTFKARQSHLFAIRLAS